MNFAARYDPLQQDSGDGMRVVTQVYSSALSCAYSGIDCDSWTALANLVLSATYEVNKISLGPKMYWYVYFPRNFGMHPDLQFKGGIHI